MNNYNRIRPMNTHTLLDNLIAALFGVFGALYHTAHTLQIYPWAKIVEGIGTALIYGAAGMAGKQLFTWIKSSIRKYKKN